MSIIDRIIEQLNAKKLSQKDLTDYLGLDKSTFSQWKNGKSQSYQKYIAEIAKFLEVSPDYLMGWTEVKEREVTLAEIIKETREKKGLSTIQLAQKIGLENDSVIIELEKDADKVPPHIMVRAAKALGLSLADLLFQSIDNVFHEHEGWPDEIAEDERRDFLEFFFYDCDFEEAALLDKFKQLNIFGKQKAIDYITDLTEQEKYTRKDNNE